LPRAHFVRLRNKVVSRAFICYNLHKVPKITFMPQKRLQGRAIASFQSLARTRIRPPEKVAGMEITLIFSGDT